GLAAPGPDLAARREPTGDAQAADAVAADRARARGGPLLLRAVGYIASEHRRRHLPRAAADDGRAGDRRAVVHLGDGPAVRLDVARGGAAAREPASGRQPEGRLPVGDRA